MARVECPPQLAFYFVQAKSRRATCFLARVRWAQALSIFVELAGDTEMLTAFDRRCRELPLRADSALHNEIATIYWSRCVCLAELARLREAYALGGELIERVGTGMNATQRSYVADLYLLQAKYAKSRKQSSKALEMLDASIAQCSTIDPPDANRVMREAEQMRHDLQAHVRIHQPPRNS